MQNSRVIVDNRPYIKTAVQKDDYFEISRRNQTTKKMYFVKIDKNVYISFLRAQKDEIKLRDENLSKEQLDFILKNILKGEIRA